MRKLAFLLMVALVAFSGWSARAQTAGQADQLANKLVHDVLHVKPNQIVVITGDTSSLPIIESLVTALREAGAFGITDIGTTREAALYYQRVPAKYDSQPPKDFLTLARIADAIVNIQFPFDPSVTKNVPPARLNATAAAFNVYTDYVLKRPVPSVFLGNGLMPSAQSAKFFGVSEDQLSSLFWSGVNTDYNALRRDGNKTYAAVTRARSVHLTAPNGTDFTFTALSNAGQINTGTISDTDRQKGGIFVQKQLPAGDVYFIPRAGTANGTIVFGPTNVNGTDVNSFKVTFRNGKLVSMHASGGGTEIAKFYATGGAGRDELGWVDLGVNRSMSVPAGRWGAAPSMAAGYITAGVGNNLGVGGSDRSPFAFASNVPNATVAVDGKAFVRNGKLTASL